MERNNKLIYHNALALHLPCIYFPQINLLRIDLGGKHYYFKYAINPMNHGASIYIAKHKYGLNRLLQRSGFPVSKATAFNKEKWSKYPLNQLIHGLNFPLVAKPMVDTIRGKDVFCNIKDISTLADYLTTFFNHHQYVQIEEFQSGLKEYRVLILKNRVIGVVERFGAYVVGDGKHTIEELIAQKNLGRVNLISSVTSAPLKFDEEYRHCLQEQGLSLQSIAQKDRTIRLCYTVNTTRGGEIFSHGKKIHPINANYLCRAAKTLGLNHVGFDVLCEDINKPFNQTKWIIVEANYNPDATIHENSNNGVQINVVRQVLKQLIYRHPCSYLYHVCIRSRLSIYFKIALATVPFVLIIHAGKFALT